MARQRSDSRTLDLLDWEPPQLVTRYEEPRVRAASLRARIAKAVSETMRDAAPLTRNEIAKAMSDWLEEEVTKNMLDAYASEARESHTIPYLRLLALAHVTGDMRPLQIGAELFGCSVIEDRWLPWVEVGELAEKKDELERRLDAARRQARSGNK